ncbi:MAG: Fic family protein [Armatimonadetes bacterium]|nr:Fic family protein [Armatimonadota bacterium]
MGHCISAPDGQAQQYIEFLQEKRIEDPSQVIEAFFSRPGSISLLLLLDQIDTLKGFLDGFRPFPATITAELKHLYDVRFTYHTNALEGNTLTQSETEMVMEKGITVGGKSLREHLEVIGHKEAIDYMEELARRGERIGEREIKGLHSLVLRGIDRKEAGRYRMIDVKAAGTEHTYPPHYRLSELMEAFTIWLQEKADGLLHPVEYAAEAHFRLVSIYPFRDGNGRTAWLLMSLLLLQRGYLVVVITHARRKDYIDALASGQAHHSDTGPLTALVADACRASLIDYLSVLSTAAEACGRGTAFYETVNAFLQKAY